jgi:riboflavin transporter FmnP
MNAKSIALTITFTAVAIALNAIRIPTIFYPGVPYQISQIPIVIAFLLFGTKIGILVGILNVAGGLILFPLGPSGIIIYPMDLVSALIMFSGLYVASRFITLNVETKESAFWKKPVVGLTIFATASRVGTMPLIDYGVTYHFLLPLVFGLRPPEAYITGLVSAFVLYNVIVPLYTIPIAYIVATKVGNHLKIEPRFVKKARDQ